MALRTVVGALIAVVAVFHPSYAVRDPGISEEVEKALAEAHFERVPSLEQRRNLVARLQRRGIETITDLHPYLGQSETVRHNALYAIEQIGDIDAKTLGLIEDLALKTASSPAPSAAMAVRLVLEQSEWPAALDFARTIAPNCSARPHFVLMTWMSAQDQSLFDASGEAAALTITCLKRLRSLFETGIYSGEQPLGFSMVVQLPPFDDSRYVRHVTAAFLSAVENAGRMRNMEKLGFIGSFSVVVRGVEGAPKLVEDGLVHIVTTGSEPLVKLILWRMSVDGFASTDSGERIAQAALKKFPGLAGYLDRLRSLNTGVAGMEDTLKNEIEHALKDLNKAARNSAGAGAHAP